MNRTRARRRRSSGTGPGLSGTPRRSSAPRRWMSVTLGLAGQALAERHRRLAVGQADHLALMTIAFRAKKEAARPNWPALRPAPPADGRGLGGSPGCPRPGASRARSRWRRRGRSTLLPLSSSPPRLHPGSARRAPRRISASAPHPPPRPPRRGRDLGLSGRRRTSARTASRPGPWPSSAPRRPAGRSGPTTRAGVRSRRRGRHRRPTQEDEPHPQQHARQPRADQVGHLPQVASRAPASASITDHHTSTDPRMKLWCWSTCTQSLAHRRLERVAGSASRRGSAPTPGTATIGWRSLRNSARSQNARGRGAPGPAWAAGRRRPASGSPPAAAERPGRP